MPRLSASLTLLMFMWHIDPQPGRDHVCHAKHKEKPLQEQFLSGFLPCLLSLVPGNFSFMQPFSDLAGQASHLKDSLVFVYMSKNKAYMIHGLK